MGYSGDQPPHKRKFDKNGNLIDPEDTLLESLADMLGIMKKSNCFRCKHLGEDEISCQAFPNVIPRDILMARVEHDKPYKGDNGIQFEPKE
jgi:hypothetical protein